jgi:predicted  nucleic acid-binding Zn-ribbon protein
MILENIKKTSSEIQITQNRLDKLNAKSVEMTRQHQAIRQKSEEAE